MITVLCSVLIIGFMWVRMNLYRYDPHGEAMIRTNRMTGQTDMLIPEKTSWITVTEFRPTPMPEPEVMLRGGSLFMQGDARIEGDMLKGRLYNQSNATLTRITIHLTQCPKTCLREPLILDATQEAIKKAQESFQTERRKAGEVTRTYHAAVSIGPQAAGNFSAMILNDAMMTDMRWKIVEIRGYGQIIDFETTEGK